MPQSNDVLNAREGDTIVLEYPDYMTINEYDRIVAAVRAAFPKQSVAILCDGIRLAGIIRQDK